MNISGCHKTVPARKRGNLDAKARVARLLRNGIHRINAEYRRGPSLYFYRRVCRLRAENPRVERFLADRYCCEMLYATLVAWDMDSRGARMKDFDDFQTNLRNALPELKAVETAAKTFDHSLDGRTATLDALVAAYRKLALMETGGRLVSNAKCLHFLFPQVCLPMDRRNTLTLLYGNTHESAGKFRAVLDFACDVLLRAGDITRHLDDRWNYTPMKMVDNAIILSVK